MSCLRCPALGEQSEPGRRRDLMSLVTSPACLGLGGQSAVVQHSKGVEATRASFRSLKGASVGDEDWCCGAGRA
jgi:hypothetical protein